MSQKKKTSNPFELSIDKVWSNLDTDKIDVIRTVYDISFHLLKREDERFLQLDTKGFNVLRMAGIALAMIFTLGGLLIEKIDYELFPFEKIAVFILTFLYILTNFTLLLTIWFSASSVKTKTVFKTMSDVDVFTDNIGKGEDESCYKKYMITHFWQIYQNNFFVNEQKGGRLKYSFIFFIISIILLFLIAIFVGAYSFYKHGLL